MKNAFNSILLLTIVGFVVLMTGAIYFGAPLFGWIIMIAIFAVFLAEQIMTLRAVKQVNEENELIASCENRKSFIVNRDGVVARRLKMAHRLTEKGIRLDSPIAFEILSASSNVAVPRSSSGTVILLGLMGTFFGLMFSVATAGSVMDNSSTQGTLDTIQLLFQNMKGIFGTSLCGLFAALILNASRTLFISARDAFMVRLDNLTLEMQSGSSSEVEKDKGEIERLFEIVNRNLNDVVNSVQQCLIGVVDKVGAEISASTAKLGNSMESIVKGIETIPARIDDKLGNISEGVKNGLESVATTASRHIAESVADQVKQSGEQWNTFMARLSDQTTASVESQKAGLETLKNVALQVAEKAQAGSAELSGAVAERLSTLSNDILAAFQKLSDSSAVLLEAQKSLTESIDNRVVKEKEATDALGGNIVETAELMRVNQSELSANLEMLRSALETILEKLSGDTAEHEEEDNFVEHLNQSLEAFHERASEVLMENAVKTQEILLEVMEQTQCAHVSAQQPNQG